MPVRVSMTAKELQIVQGAFLNIIERHMKKGMLVAQAEAKVKVSGQVLKVRTGHLRRSISTKVRRSGKAVRGILFSNVIYARVHELGFRGVVGVKKHTRKGHPVKAHLRRVDFPKRPFLMPALKEKLDRIIDFLQKQISRDAKKELFK